MSANPFPADPLPKPLELALSGRINQAATQGLTDGYQAGYAAGHLVGHQHAAAKLERLGLQTIVAVLRSLDVDAVTIPQVILEDLDGWQLEHQVDTATFGVRYRIRRADGT